MYLVEFAGDDDPFAACEAEHAATGVATLAPGLAIAGGLDRERARRLAYTRRVSRSIGYVDVDTASAADDLGVDPDEALESARTLLEAAPVDRTGTVAVRTRDVRGTTGVDTQRIERELGSVLTDRGFAVDLDEPDHELRALFSAPRLDTDRTEPVPADPPEADGGPRDGREACERGVCALGWLVVESVRDYGDRQPSKRPFFQPGSMDPLFARALATIAGAGPGRTIVDPMCGTGGILLEAGLVGSRVVGIDAQRKMVRGATRNLARYLDGGFAVARGDVTRLPLRDDDADGVCFDLPYGRQSKIAGGRDELVDGALVEARRIAPRAVVVSDRPLETAARRAGWTVRTTFERRVHRSLTRHVAVLERSDERYRGGTGNETI